jgi:hypothetical protein
MTVKSIVPPSFGPFALALLLLGLVGCERRFTHARFEMIQEGCDNRDDVREILGKPTFTSDDLWYYEDLDRHQHAQIFFAETGCVLSKEWMSAKPGGKWEGQNPYTNPPPQGEIRERHTRTQRIDED